MPGKCMVGTFGPHTDNGIRTHGPAPTSLLARFERVHSLTFSRHTNVELCDCGLVFPD